MCSRASSVDRDDEPASASSTQPSDATLPGAEGTIRCSLCARSDHPASLGSRDGPRGGDGVLLAAVGAPGRPGRPPPVVLRWATGARRGGTRRRPARGRVQSWRRRRRASTRRRRTPRRRGAVGPPRSPWRSSRRGGRATTRSSWRSTSARRCDATTPSSWFAPRPAHASCWHWRRTRGTRTTTSAARTSTPAAPTSPCSGPCRRATSTSRRARVAG